MLKYRQENDVGISGNRMRHGSSNQIVLDERWKKEMTDRHLLIFNIIGGWMNKIYGY